MQALSGQCAVECGGSRAKGRRGGLLWAARVAQCCVAARCLWESRCGSPRRPSLGRSGRPVLRRCPCPRLFSADADACAAAVVPQVCAWHSERDLHGQMHAAVSGARRVTSRRAGMAGVARACMCVRHQMSIPAEGLRPELLVTSAETLAGPSGGMQRPDHRAMVGAAISSASRARSAAWCRHACWRASRLSLPEDGPEEHASKSAASAIVSSICTWCALARPSRKYLIEATHCRSALLITALAG